MSGDDNGKARDAPDSRASPEARVEDHPEHSRYELFYGGRLVGHVNYRVDPRGIVMIHTEIDPAFEGRGLGTILAKGALDEARRRGAHVVPQCPYIAGYIRRHREYRDLVAR